MSKKAILLLAGILAVAAGYACYINCVSKQISKTYQYKKTANTYQLQKLANETSSTALPAAGSWQNDFPNANNSNVLGIAGKFNFFAKNIDSTANNSLNGNFATQNLTTGAWIINGTSSKISYIQQEVDAGDGVQLELLGEKVVLGQSLLFSGTGPTIEGHVVKTVPNSFTQDSNGLQYIDINSEFNRLMNNSKIIADNSSNNVPTITNQYGKVTFDASNIVAQDNVKYLTVKSNDMPGEWGQLDIKGISDQQRVVLTIDTSGVNNITFRYSEINGTENKNILFNFYNVTDNSNYSGTIDWNKTTGNVADAILAPNATVNLFSESFKGNIVALNFNKKNTTHDSGYYPDVSVPSNTTTPVITPKLISVPDVDFGSHKLNSETSLIGSWKGKFQVSGEKGKEIKINVELAKQFVSQNDSVASGVNWQLVKSDYSSGSLLKVSQDFTSTSASINYWVWKDDNTGDLLSDWNYNKENKQYGFYDMQISNLATVTDAGNYTATLKWTLVDSP
ncbi:collagen-binding domain-containing protein [Leuconostoc suionicum]|uniref:collagen-binding domain-containing protein n=1 Tax=Leuconostoc suionicum TaxID=1511761 RepID=UPI001B8CFD42|nr:collagen-binding domain-containing protein [Leuconostoc suionicum]MBS1008501.1 choice-of-anchor A family protein [Leuconostoc suionicum]